jgi:predicted TPR repeat methyltransferase
MPEYFGERVAAVYDDLAADMFDAAVVTPVVEMLAELAGEGRALELGIGTGRIALPLAERGVRVHGVDSSEPMVTRLRAKPGARRSMSPSVIFRRRPSRDSFAGLPRFQHDLQPRHAG